MKTNLMKTFNKLGAMLGVAAITILSVVQSHASPFTYGNIAVLQDGDGVNTLSATSAPVAILEFTVGGSLVQTINIPTSGVNRLTEVGSSGTEGYLSRSLNTSNLVFAGYDANAGGVGPANSNSVAINRLVGQVDYNGNFTRTAISSLEYSTYNNRSAASDGTNYWTTGGGGSGGIWYSANGGTPIQIGNESTSGGNLRVAKIFNGQLYYSTASGTVGIFACTNSSGTGLPTTPPVPTNGSVNVIVDGGSSPSPYDFAINPTTNIIYVCDDRATASGGGIQKWTYSGGIWTSNYTFGAGAGLTAGCRAIAVDFTGANPIIYATTADTATKLITITDSGASALATTLATATTDKAFRGVALTPGSASSGPPSITGISPSSIVNSAGSSDVFSVTDLGAPPLSYFWYKEIPGTSTNLIATATTASLSFPSAAVSDTASYQVVVSNSTSITVTSAVVTLTITNAPPGITGIGPASLTNKAGTTAKFTVTNTGTPPFGYMWYVETATATNLISGATNATLTLSNVLGGDAANYQVVITNVTGLAVTSAVVSLTVTNDPNITFQPASTYGLVDGVVQFAVGVAGTSPSYQWYYSDGSGDILSSVSDGMTTASGVAVVSGSSTGTLTISNLQPADLTNFVVVVTNVYGSVTSSVASLLAVNLTDSTIAFWNFNQIPFVTNNPIPWFGVGSASAFGSILIPGTSPFAGSADPGDGPGFGLGLTNYSWGTSTYPASGSNKLNGLEFNVSTLGAKDIKVSYDSRVSATASDYERLQYTTNGTDWIDYPTSSTFGGVAVNYLAFSYDLTGFPGVANNPNFGIRVVTEFQSTATYGVSTNSNYAGTSNTYGTGGTITYDRVLITGDAITNNNEPPVVSSIPNTNTPDYIPITNYFTVSDDTTPPDQLTYSAVSLNTATVNGTFTFGGTGINRYLVITPNYIPDQVDAAPILVTVTDTNGDSTATWFTLTLGSINLAPTNTLTAISATNTLANTAITIPFTVSDDRTPVSGLTYSVSSDNSTLIPSGNIVVNNQGTANPSVTITPATNQLGVAEISVTVYDNDGTEPRSTTANIAFMVRPNTNVVAVDYFDYDGGGSLDTVSGGFWSHLSGGLGQMKVASGFAIVDTLDNTENLQTGLLGAPYYKTNGAVLYSSFIVNMDPTKMPLNNGTYFAAFNDGSGVTANVEGLVVATTNGAASGYYRLGIANAVGATGTNSQIFPVDLSPNSNYVVVVSLQLTNGFSTLWINPTNQSSQSVTDTTVVAAATNNISDFELRESGANAGSVSVGSLIVGLTFNSVIYPPVANPDNYSVTENTANDSFSPLLNDVSGGILSLVGVSATSGTASISGTNVLYTPPSNFTGTDTIAYTNTDDLGNTSSSTITVTVTNIPPTANADSYSVAANSSGNVFTPLANDVLNTSGGTLALVGVSSPTPNSGTATISGTTVLYTPASNFTGTDTITYTNTDGIGGTGSSTITVTVTNVPPATIIPTIPPGITGLTIANGNVTISGTNAQATGVYYLLQTTNVALPLSQWTTVATNVISTANNFTFVGTNVVFPGSPGQFYILSSTNYNP